MPFLSAQPRAQPHQHHKQGPKKGAGGGGWTAFSATQSINKKFKRPLCYSTYEKNVTWGHGSRYLLSAALVLLWVIRAALRE